MMLDWISKSIDHAELTRFLTTKGTKFTVEINKREIDDPLEFNMRSGNAL